MTDQEPVRLVALVEMADGRTGAGIRYEDGVLALLGAHGGTLERRLRTHDGRSEVHIITFAARAGLESFLVDPRRLALRAGAGDAAPTTTVLEVSDVP